MFEITPLELFEVKIFPLRGNIHFNLGVWVENREKAERVTSKGPPLVQRARSSTLTQMGGREGGSCFLLDFPVVGASNLCRADPAGKASCPEMVQTLQDQSREPWSDS